MKEIQHEQTGWCGPARLQFIASKEGIAYSQVELARLMSTSEEEGTSQENLHKGAKEIGLEVFQLKGLGIEELSTLLDNHYIIVNWMDGPNDLGDGHYSLLKGVENGLVYLDDAVMPIPEFEGKWYDLEDGKRVDKWSLIVWKRKGAV